MNKPGGRELVLWFCHAYNLNMLQEKIHAFIYFLLVLLAWFAFNYFSFFHIFFYLMLLFSILKINANITQQKSSEKKAPSNKKMLWEYINEWLYCVPNLVSWKLIWSLQFLAKNNKNKLNINIFLWTGNYRP